MQSFQLILDGIKNNSFLRDDVLQFLAFFAGLRSSSPVSVSTKTTCLTENGNRSEQSCNQPVIPSFIQSLLQAVPTEEDQLEVCFNHSFYNA